MEQLGTYLLDKRVNSKNYIIELTVRTFRVYCLDNSISLAKRACAVFCVFLWYN